MTICSKFLDILDKLPLYDRQARYGSRESRTLAWDAVRKLNLTSATDISEMSTYASIPIDEIILGGGIKSIKGKTELFLEEINREKLELNNSKLVSSSYSENLNDGIVEAIQGCINKQKRGLTAQVLLSEDWERFRLRVNYNPFQRDNGINFSIETSENIILEETEENPRVLESEGQNYIQFKRKDSKPGRIYIVPGNEETKFPEQEIIVPEATKLVRVFSGEILIRTNWYSANVNGLGEEKDFIVKLDPIGGGHNELRDNSSNDILQVVLSYDESTNKHSARVVLRAPHVNPVDGFARVSATIDAFDQPTGWRVDPSHHAGFEATMVTRHIFVNVEKYEQITKDADGHITVDDTDVLVMPALKARELKVIT